MLWPSLRSLLPHSKHVLIRLRCWPEAKTSYGGGQTQSQGVHGCRYYTSRLGVYGIHKRPRTIPWIPSHHGKIRRTISITAVYTVLTPPAVFVGLVLSLWAYKCCMMILFQNKIIYMPSIPPFSRSEKLEDYARRCSPIVWREQRLKAADGVDLSLCIASTASHGSIRPQERHVIILYFQG